MYDPRGILKDFKLRARPEVCVGTPESIQSHGTRTARASERSSSGKPLRLTPEPVPPGTPPGWRAFRFTHPEGVWLGTVCGVVYDPESGNTAFVMHDIPPQESWMLSGPPSFTTKQAGPTLAESHVLIPPNGFVSTELIANIDETQSGKNGKEPGGEWIPSER